MAFRDEFRALDPERLKNAWADSILDATMNPGALEESLDVANEQYAPVATLIDATANFLMNTGVDRERAILVAAGVSILTNTLKKYGEMEIMEGAGPATDNPPTDS